MANIWYYGLDMRKLWRIFLGLVMLLALAGGVGLFAWMRLVDSIKPLPGFEAKPTVEPVPVTTELGKWREVAPEVDRTEFGLGEAGRGTMVMYRFAPEKFQPWIMVSHNRMPVAKWAGTFFEPSGQLRDTLVVNGVYFNEDGSPSGLVQQESTPVGTRQFDLDKSGLIVFSPAFRIIDTSKEKVDLKMVASGAQSYPFLVRDGVAGVEEDSGLVARRTFIGQDVDGMIYVGAVTQSQVSLFGLGKALVGTGIKWQSVLNLDGGPSTGLVARFGDWLETQDSLVSVPSVIVIYRK